LGLLLEDIGARNSDVLLSDAVLFVEGQGDKATLEIWSETLGKPFAEHNVTVLPMRGGEHAGQGAPARSEVLEGISERSPIPHLFLIDRDERSPAEVTHLEKALPGRIHVLIARELENYMLVPGALRAAVRSKCRQDAQTIAKVDQSTDAEVQQIMEEAASALYGVVLLKRIRSSLGGLAGGLLPREAVNELVPLAAHPDLAGIIRERVTARVAERLRAMDVEALVARERETLDREWDPPARRLVLAPGEEIINAVFAHFGTTYKKPGDTRAIAREIQAGEIAPEIKGVIARAVGLADRSRGVNSGGSR